MDALREAKIQTLIDRHSDGGGAAMKAVREEKQLAPNPRTRAAQVRITLTTVPRRTGGGR